MNANATNAIRSLFLEIQLEILDDCGHWDMPVDVMDIIDCALNGDLCEEGEFEAILDGHGLRYDNEAFIQIALTLQNTYRRTRS